MPRLKREAARSGGLFTREFFERIRTHLTERGVFAQWLHLYESEGRLVESVLAAVHASFGDVASLADRRS
jgi:spermidine synthase